MAIIKQTDKIATKAPKSATYPHFIIYGGGLNPYLCDNVLSQTESIPWKKGEIIGGADNQKVRKSSIKFLKPSHNLAVIDALLTAMKFVAKCSSSTFDIKLNKQPFGFVQLTQYTQGQYYDWHTDGFCRTGGDPNLYSSRGTRKMTIVASLDGGGIELKPFGMISMHKGDVIAFPSTMYHRAYKQEEGERHSVVAWCLGPDWQ